MCGLCDSLNQMDEDYCWPAIVLCIVAATSINENTWLDVLRTDGKF